MLQNNRLIRITTGTSRKATAWVGQELYWSDFVQRLSQPVRTQESLGQYKSLTRAEQDALKDIGGFVGGTLKGPRRKNENAGERDLITLDADTIEPGGTQKVLNAVDALGCAYAVYSTRKHEGAAPRLRIIIPLDAPCSADEYEPIARKAASFIGMQVFDPTTFEPVRLMYWPSCSSDSQYVFAYGDKPFLSRSGMLGYYRDWRDVTEWPEVPGAAKVRDRSARKQGDPIAKKGVVGAFCKAFTIEEAMTQFIPGIYEPCADPGRFTYVEGSTVGGAVLYEGGKFLYSHHATDPCSGRLVNAFDMVRLHLFGSEDDGAKPDTPAANMPSFRKMCEFASEIPAIADAMAKERYEAAVSSFSGGLPGGQAKDDAAWVLKLQSNPKTGAPLNTIQNVQAILGNDPLLKGRIYHDEMAGRPMVSAPLPWEPQSGPYMERQWKDEDDSGLRGYLEAVYQITGKEKVADGFAVFAMNHKVHRLKDYLAGLVWDGVPRVDTLLVDYFGAEDNAYTREAIRKTLVGAVARVFSPGVKFDTMLILAGRQGIGKSSFFRFLGMGWYSDSLCTFEGKDAAELLQGYWIIEAGELNGMTKSEMNTVKQFLSKCDDVYRAAYGRRTEKYPRQCIIVGTTNESEFLKDYTGNRRFWPVDLSGVSRKHVRHDMPPEVPQIWAEAVALYRLGEPLILSPGAEKMAENAQEVHREASYSEGAIVEFLGKRVPKDWYRRTMYERRAWLDSEFDQKQADESQLMYRDRICAWEIWNECFRMPGYNRMKKSDSKEINGILERLPGWERQKSPLRFGGEYGAQRGFQRATSNV